MASLISRAQEIITCDLCNKPTQQFCNNCQVSLCVDCVSKHVDKHKSLTHDIVPFKNRKIQLVFPECEFHPHQRCEAHCQQCDVPVCIKCFLGNHKGHDAVELSNIVENKKQQIEKETKEIETVIIPKYQKSEGDIKSKASKCTAKYDELEQDTERHRKLWHNEVDSIFNKFCSLIRSMKDKNLGALEAQQTKLKSLIPEMKKTVKQNKEILKTNRVSQVTNYKSKLTEYRNTPTDIDIEIPSPKTNTLNGKELSIELGDYNASLTQSSLSILTEEVSYLSMRELLDEARVIATIPTLLKPLYRVACVGADEAWVSGDDKIIKRVGIYRSIRDTVRTSSSFYPVDIKVTREGELIYSDVSNGTINIVKRGKKETLITSPRDWTATGLCCTKSGDILVNMHKEDQNKIVRYQGQRVKQEIYEDEDEKLIYGSGTFSLLMVENNNEDICVSDLNAGTVVVTNKAGKVRFRYDSTPAKRKEPFNPRLIVTDSMSQIIVVDFNNDCLHILDQDGEFLRCVDNCGLEKPCGLSVDSKGRLWVGLIESGEVKVIQYMK